VIELIELEILPHVLTNNKADSGAMMRKSGNYEVINKQIIDMKE